MAFPLRATPLESDVPMGSTDTEQSQPAVQQTSSMLVEHPSGLLNVQPEPPRGPVEERSLIMAKEQASQGLVAGRLYCLVDAKWYREWQQWVGDPSASSPKHGPVDMAPSPIRRERSWSKDRPGPIDNAMLLDSRDSDKLRQGISEHEHYELVSEDVWNLLYDWYKGPGPVFKRRAIQQPSGNVIVELHGLNLKVVKSSDINTEKKMMEFRKVTVKEFKERACAEFGLDVTKVRIWDYFNNRKHELMEGSKLNDSLEDNRIYDNNDILLEEQLPDGSWPPEEKQSFSTFSTSCYNRGMNSGEDVPTSGSPPERGACGLQNLGNTCFMNSSLQCLSAVPELRKYFEQDAYKDSLNEGAHKTKGKLAQSFASLLKHMWNPNTTQVAPRNFKWQIGQFAEQFAGYGQQDSMEFIEYVLDGLKEDVNKVQGAKPYVEFKDCPPDADANAIRENALETKDGYRRRNDSKIDDLFYGLLKSTVSCPEPGCGKVSVKFDPMASIKLPLVSPVEQLASNYQVTVCFTASPKVPMQKLTVTAPKSGSAPDLLEATAKKVNEAPEGNLNAQNLIAVEIYSSKVFKFFEHDLLTSINTMDKIVVYELPDPGTSGDKVEAVIHCRQKKSSSYGGSYQSNYSSYSSGLADPVGIPFPMYVNRNFSGQDLIDAVRAEFTKRVGDSMADKWRLMKSSEKGLHNLEEVDEKKEKTEYPSSWMRSSDRCDRIYLVVEFDTSFQIPEVFQKMKENDLPGCHSQGGSSNNQQPVELQRCFKMYAEETKLSSMDTWYCNKCKEHREAFKKIEFWELPPILIVQLMRFQYNQYSRDRLDTPIKFPLEGLDLQQYVTGPEPSKYIYDLAAVSKHIGGMGGGHYVAYSRSSENGKWYYFNDSSVKELTNWEEVEGETVGAYVLFYLRSDRKPDCWGARPKVNVPDP